MIGHGAGSWQVREWAGPFSVSLILHLCLVGALLGSQLFNPVRLPKKEPAIQYVDLVTGSVPAPRAGGAAAAPVAAKPALAAAKPAQLPAVPAPAPAKDSTPLAPPRAVAPPVFPSRPAAPAAPTPSTGRALPATAQPAAGVPFPSSVLLTTGAGRFGASGAGTGTGTGTGTETGKGSGSARHGSGGTEADTLEAYRALLVSLIDAHKKYPLAARRMRQEGSCQRILVLSRSGALKEVASVSSCGSDFLDEAATGAIKSVAKFPPFPEELKGSEKRIQVSIAFTLSKK